MANLTVTVKSSGGTYTTLASALSTESKDLVTNTQILTIELYASASSAETGTADTGAGYTASASYYINIVVPASERHHGKYDETGHYYRTGVIVNQAGYTRIVGVQQKITTTSTDIYGVENSGANTWIDKHISKGVLSGGANACFAIYTSATITVTNTLIFDWINGTNTIRAFHVSGGANSAFYNCSIVDTYIGWYLNIVTAVIKNCGLSGVTTYYTGDAPGTETTNSQSTPTFVNSGADDFHLASNDTTWKGQGTADPASGLFSDDIDGVTRTGTWDIGADEYNLISHLQDQVGYTSGSTSSVTTASGTWSAGSLIALVIGWKTTARTILSILHSAIIGDSTTGTDIVEEAADRIYARAFTHSGATAPVDTIYVRARVESGTGSVQVAIYDSGDPGTRLAYSTAAGTITTTVGWVGVKLTSPLTLTNGVTYRLAMNFSVATVPTGAATGGDVYWVNQTYGTWPSSATWGGSNAVSYDIYASGSNTWQAAGSIYTYGSNGWITIWYAYNITGFTGTITATLSGSATQVGILASEFSGFGTSDPYDTSNGGGSYSATPATANITSFDGDEVVIGGIYNPNGYAYTSPLINEATPDGTVTTTNMISMYDIRTATMTGHAQAAITASDWCAIVASFKYTAGGVAPLTVNITDSIYYVLTEGGGGTTYNRYPYESIGLTDATSYTRVLRRYPYESIGVTDSQFVQKTLRRYLAENCGVTDSAYRVKLMYRYLADNLGLTDAESVTRVLRRWANESVGVTDSLSASKVLIRFMSDNLGITDSAVRVKQMLRYLADNLGITDNQYRIMSAVRAVADNLGVTDSRNFTMSMLRVFAESVGLTDARVSGMALRRIVAESVNLSDALFRMTFKAVMLAESLGITDAQLRKMDTIRQAYDTVGVTDARSRIASFARQVIDNLGVTDAAARFATMPRVIAESLGITDARYSQIILNVWVRTVADSVGVSDFLSRAVLKVRQIADSCGVTDARTIQKAMFRVLSEALGIVDATYQRGDWKRYPAEALSVQDARVSGMAYLRKLVEQLGVTDAITEATILVILRAIADTVGLTDARGYVGGKGRYVADSVGVTDARAKLLSIIRGIAESLGVTDFDTLYKQIIRSLPEGVGVYDDAEKFLAYVRKITESYGISDSALPGLLKLRSIAESIGIADADTWAVLTAAYLSLLIGLHAPFALLAAKSKRISTDCKDHRVELDSYKWREELDATTHRITLGVE